MSSGVAFNELQSPKSVSYTHLEYEMVSGHRRMHAAQLAGLTTIPAIVRELSDDDAIVAMVDANIQREGLLPSEKDVYKRQCQHMS